MPANFLNEKESKLVDLLIEGHTVTDIHRELNITRQTVYTWMEKEHIKAELDSRRRELARQGNNLIMKDLTTYIESIKALARDKSDKRVSLAANQYLLNRIYGNPAGVLDESNSNNDENVDKNELEMELEAFKGKLKRVK